MINGIKNMDDDKSKIKQLEQQNEMMSSGIREFAAQMQVLDDLSVSIANITNDQILDDPLKIAFDVRNKSCDLLLRLAKRRLDYSIERKLPIVRNPEREAIWQKHCQDQIKNKE